jgi:NAD(P)-dependent dehydrogenase (short-subunit alcohol dehydrogenase family)
MSKDISTWAGGQSLVETAIDAFGQLDALVNNAGILRDSFISGMSEDQWDAVITVHLKGHFVPLRHAVDHWKARSKAGEEVNGAVVNTASASGTFLPNPGQSNYGAAKAGIAAMTLVASQELGRYGVRVNGIAPAARTRLTIDVPMIGEMVKAPEDPDAFDRFHPKHVSPLVAWLVSADCPLTGQMFAVQGGSLQRMTGWTVGDGINTEGDWTIDNIAAQLGAARV